MSAFVVSKRHIDAIVSAGLSDQHFSWYTEDEFQPHRLDYTNADEVGSMLWAENVRSVQHRYPDTLDNGEYPGPISFEAAQVFTYRHKLIRLEPVAILKAIACYEYQSCEHPEWDKSSARAFCAALTAHTVTRLPGYNEAPWEVDA